MLGEHVLEMTMSVGVTQHRSAPVAAQPNCSPSDAGALGDWLLRSADQAMYVAKHSGKGQAVLSAS